MSDQDPADQAGRGTSHGVAKGPERNADVSVATAALPTVDISIVGPERKNPLLPFSLLGRAEELEAKAADTKPLLGDFIMSGQATMIYAAPNTGKTLIVLNLLLDAIEQGRIDPDRVFYVNADDTSKGVAAKARLLKDVGAHMVVPGL
ncbi:AAA family ATPase [Brevundimonas sp. Leaf363]|uniref:AAA family ATPase n=1 Tax=Brevundimonas sp. Leaf363 TaxID=1736353 RepID=UPI00138ED265|nr:AAA family ATPase [Brevundimonas sp. Leaf363]